MLRSIKSFIGNIVNASDGKMGKVKDALFDDRYWRLRYVVVDTGAWLPGKKILLSPSHLVPPDTGGANGVISVDFTKLQIEQSPSLETDAPVSQQYEEEFAKYYKIPLYWMDSYACGRTSEPAFVPPLLELQSETGRQAHKSRLEQIEHVHLRSVNEILGYRIEAKDDSFGHVEDFIIDDASWRLQYLAIDTKDWLPGKASMIDIGWTEDFDWNNKTARVELLRKQIEMAPKYDPYELVNEDAQQHLYDYYGKPRHSESLAAPFF